ncbi:MAG: glycoside hydrolase family 9 protein [Sphingobacteriia bacterium]|nr:glycoside hydrolase family 9 protein [Sphingobacteriia bacterium]
MKKIALYILVVFCFSFKKEDTVQQVIRINQLGYTTGGIKVAVWCSKQNTLIDSFQIIDSATKKIVFKSGAGKAFGGYGPFNQTYRLNFSEFKKPGKYFIQCGKAQSPVFTIADDVYKGAADFCLQYMRQQRSGFNPFLKDSCHTHDGYVLYGLPVGIKDSTHINVSGGWHDASDYLQYSSTSANATYHLLAAYRDFPEVFKDEKLSNGLDGSNGVADVLDEAKWGLDWLLKMHPSKNIMFNQLGDDRDHRGMRIPKEDSYYGKGFERPVYFIDGEKQQRGKFLNNTTGTSSTAAKFSSAFALGYELFKKEDKKFANILKEKAIAAYAFANKKKGVTQTVSVVSPYIYEEADWQDDMGLAATHMSALINNKKLLDTAYKYLENANAETWIGKDTAKHYQYYPFIHLGVNELTKRLGNSIAASEKIISYSNEILAVLNKAKQNAFYRAIPFIWCSNNLTTAFATECFWYRQRTGDQSFIELEQANFDWLFGCNPWGTSMVYGLPAWGDTPVDPHSAFTHLKNYPINGGLVDGPVYTSIYNNLIGIKLTHEDAYAAFQSDLAVYHDDYGDYSTNEPTMDGTANLIYLLAAKESESKKGFNFSTNPRTKRNLTYSYGAAIRGDSTKREIALVFTADEFGEGIPTIVNVLSRRYLTASFFFTGRFYNDPKNAANIKLIQDKFNELGPHSNDHLLYCDWNKRDSTLISRQTFVNDFHLNEDAMDKLHVREPWNRLFIPPYEWWNNDIAKWCHELGIQLFNFTPGSATNADYTYPELEKQYKSSEEILQRVYSIAKKPNGLNGYILLIHAGTDNRRTDKLYDRLEELLGFLEKENYKVLPVGDLLYY